VNEGADSVAESRGQFDLRDNSRGVKSFS
jgi:hypothetical protein